MLHNYSIDAKFRVLPYPIALLTHLCVREAILIYARVYAREHFQSRVPMPGLRQHLHNDVSRFPGRSWSRRQMLNATTEAKATWARSREARQGMLQTWETRGREKLDELFEHRLVGVLVFLVRRISIGSRIKHSFASAFPDLYRSAASNASNCKNIICNIIIAFTNL